MISRILAVALVIVLISAGVLSMRYTQPSSIVSALARGQYQRAVALLEKPSLSANSGARVTLGNLYYLGLGVEQNFSVSARYYSEAAFAGSTAAQVNLGHLYSSGMGVDQDTTLAFAWFNLANRNGSQIAQEYMSEILSQHRLNFRVVEQLKVDYATINQFEKLHQVEVLK